MKNRRRLSQKKWRENNPDKVKGYKTRWYQKYKERIKAYARKWRKANPEKVRAHDRKNHHGITDEQFKSMVKKQKNRCAICRRKETWVDWRTGEIKALSIDHDHKTNKIRKLLCRSCNVGIGIFRDSVPLLQKVIAYLNEERTR